MRILFAEKDKRKVENVSFGEQRGKKLISIRVY
jgi:hypothetical protein